MRVGLIFNEPLVGEAVACLLESRRPWSVGFIAGSTGEALESLAENPVGVLLVDGLDEEALPRLLALRDANGPPVMMLVAESEIDACLDLPLDRVLPRRASTDEILVALDDLAKASLRPRPSALPYDLSRREHECAQLVSRGMSNRRIAEMTGLREQSVKNVVSFAMRKLGVDNRVQIALRLSAASPDSAVESSRGKG